MIAQQYLDVHSLNAGGDGYTIDSAWASVQGFPRANGFLYLLINNDAEAAFRWTRSYPAITSICSTPSFSGSFHRQLPNQHLLNPLLARCRIPLGPYARSPT